MAAPVTLTPIALLLLATAAHAQWTVRILHPVGAGQSSALGVSDTQQVGFTFTLTDNAALWNKTAASFINLHPASASESHAYAVAGGKQIGDVFDTQLRASLWSGTAASWIDLSPAGTFRSQALGISGNQQVGVARVGLFDHAGFWTGTAGSWVDLHPATATTSIAYDTNAQVQVGAATINNVLSAGRWNGTAASFINLHPSGIGATGSVALAVYGNTIAGYAAGVGGHASHACTWANGTAASFTDLNPANSTESQALDTDGDSQVGYVRLNSGQSIASIWLGSAATWEDLSLALPGNWVATRAEKIYPSFHTAVVVGHGFNLATNRREAIMWMRCYINCDGSTSAPMLTANDFQCFLNKFATGDPYANCDLSTSPPILNANDFQCFVNIFAAGCS